MNRLRSLLHVERGEELPAFFLFLYLGLALTSFLIVKATRDAVFLNRFSATALPKMWVAVAVVMGLVVPVYLRVSARLGLATLITRTLVFFMVNVVLLWWAAGVRWSPLAAVFYIWSSIFGIVVPTQVWTVANRVLDVRQAKRLFPLISSGGILGSVAGGLIAAAAVKRLGTYHLLLVLVPLLALCALLARLLIRRYAYSRSGIQSGVNVPAKRGGPQSLWKRLKPLVQSRYLMLIAIVVGLSAIVTMFVNYQFNVVVQHSIHSRDQLTAFFGSFYAFLNFVALLLQLLAGRRLAERFGVRVMLFILPTALVSGTLLLLAYPMRLWAALILKGSDPLRYSIDRSTVELLYLPVPQSLKADAKPVIDMMVLRVAEGVAGVLLWVMTKNFGVGLAGVSVFSLALISVWLCVAFPTGKEYVGAVLRAILRERPDLPKVVVRMVFSNAKSIASLRSMLESKDEEVVLYAMDLAVALRRKEWVPAHLVNHPSGRVRLKAMEIVPMTEKEIKERVQTEHDSAVRASGIMRLCRVVRPGEPLAVLPEYLRDPNLKVRLGVLACLARETEDRGAQTLKDHLTEITRDLHETSEQWTDVAEALGEIRHPATVDLHIRLLKHPNLRVRKEAIRAAARAQHRELVPFLVRLLADRDVGAEARRALQEWGPRILGTMGNILQDAREDVEVRRNIPLVLAYNPNQASVDLLLESLFDEDGLLRYRAIRALGKLRALDPGLGVDAEKVGLCLQRECEKALHYEESLACLYPQGDGKDLLAMLLNDKINYGRERVFRLLSLILPQSVAYACFLALKEEDRVRKANAAEYLVNALPEGLRTSIMPLVEAKKSEAKQKPKVGKILEQLMKSPDAVLRDCVADAIAKGRWPEVTRTSPATPRLKEGFSYG